MANRRRNLRAGWLSIIAAWFFKAIPGGLFALLFFLIPSPTQAAEELFPFVLPWDDASASATNLSSRLDKPAGAQGFVTVREGHLSAGGSRIRLFGVNLCFGACFPTHAEADKIAARMAKFGIGCVRFHHMDTQAAPDGLLQGDKRTFSPEALDRLDYFIAALKKNGIYSDLNLHVGRLYPGAPPWPGMPEYFKGVDLFFPAFIEAQKDYARKLLTHVNPYTKTAYAEEPAVAFVEINNENSLVGQWWKGTLDSMPDPYRSELRGRWTQWLGRAFGGEKQWRAAWNEALPPPGDELLEHRDKRKRWDAWVLEQHDTPATLNRGPGPERQLAWNVHVERPGRENWHVQINQAGLKLEQGKPYTFTFTARSDTPRRVNIAVGQAHAPWQNLWNTEIEVTPAWKKYHVAFTPGESDPNLRIGFTNLAQEAGDFFFCDPSLRQGGTRAPEGEAAQGDLLRKSDFAGNSQRIQETWIRFLWEQEGAYWREMAQFLRTDLKTRSLLIGSQLGFSPFPLQAGFDVMDVHAYWQHPVFPKNQWDLVHWTVRNVPMAGAPDGGTLPPMALARVAGKPYICTEYNHAAPNTFSSEAFLLSSAYAALQDWDAVFAFAYSHRSNDWNAQRFSNFFDIDQNPTKMATLPAAVSLFCRGDVHPPSAPAVAHLTLQEALARVQTSGPILSAENFGLKWQETFLHPVAISLGEESKAAPALPPASTGECLISDNQELTWDSRKHRLVTIATKNSKGVIGFVLGQTFALGGINITPTRAIQKWAAIMVTDLDPAPASNPKRFLVTATGLSENSRMGWKAPDGSTVGRDWGRAPSLVEGIGARIDFLGRSNLRAWALDGRGQRQREIPVRKNALEIRPEYQTLWYEVEAGEEEK